MAEYVPEPTVDLDIRGVVAWIEAVEPGADEPVLIVSDGEVTVRFTLGAGGKREQAQKGAARLLEGARVFAGHATLAGLPDGSTFAHPAECGPHTGPG